MRNGITRTFFFSFFRYCKFGEQTLKVVSTRDGWERLQTPQAVYSVGSRKGQELNRNHTHFVFDATDLHLSWKALAKSFVGAKL
jgi:hypothetical protein